MLSARRSGSSSSAAFVVHRVYGFRIRTAWAIEGVDTVSSDSWDVELVEGDAERLTEAASYVPPHQTEWWAQSAELPDGASYRRWSGLFEFLVSPDGRSVHARLLHEDAHEEALLAYLFVDALSFSMVRLGIEPLHATAVLTAAGAAAFLGDSGDGKSTMAALLVHGGGRLLTDDMLILTESGGRFLAQIGPPRIKLYRDIAARIFGEAPRGVPMNAATEKLIIPLHRTQMADDPQALKALYLLRNEPRDGATPEPRIDALSPADAVPRVLAGMAAHCPSGRDRLRRQFDFVTRLVARVPIKTLSYRRQPDSMGIVRDAVLADLERTKA